MNLQFTTRAAHVHRDGKITCTLLIENVGGIYQIRREGEDDILFRKSSLYEIQDAADMYLAGFMAGYDDGVDHATKERTQHSNTYDENRKAVRKFRGSGRKPAFESERGDRTDVERAGEDQHPS